MAGKVHPLIALAVNTLLPESRTTVSAFSEYPEVGEVSPVRGLRHKDGAVVFILGRRESGKTVLAYRLAEILGRPVYAVTPEQRSPRGVTELELADLDTEPPPGSTLILDDLPAYMGGHDYNNPYVRTVERLIPVVRHRRKLHLIFISQSSALSDRHVLTADIVMLKTPSILYLETERPQVARLYKKVEPLFDEMSDLRKRKMVYVLSETWKGMAEVNLPTR
ncbi:MAG: hypothetical protein ABIH46_12225 [Chloroflexota bacterium]